MKVLLEGPPRAGKTTLIRGLVILLQAEGRRLAGFLTEEVRDREQRVGFALRTLDGERGLLAHVDLPGPPRVGRYGVDLAVVDGLAVPSLSGEADVVIIDELAAMELASPAFRLGVRQLFEAPRRVVATVHVDRHPVTDALKARHDVHVLRVTSANPDHVSQSVLKLLREE